MAGDEIFCETFSIEAHLVYWCLNSHECSVDDVVSVALAFVSTVNIQRYKQLSHRQVQVDAPIVLRT